MRWHTEAVCLLTASPSPLPLRTYVFMMWKISWELQHRQNRWLLLLLCCAWSCSWERYSKMFCPHLIISTGGHPNEQACAHALVYSSSFSSPLHPPGRTNKTFTADTAQTTIKQQNFDKLLPCWRFMITPHPRPPFWSGNSSRVESFFALIKGLMVSCKYLLSAFGAASDSSPQPADQNPMANKQQQQQLWGRKRRGEGSQQWGSHVAPLDVALLHWASAL